MNRGWLVFAGSLVVVAVSACTSSTSSTPGGSLPTAAPARIGASGLSLKQMVVLPNVPPGAKFTYDIGAVDPLLHNYYLADRTNAALDIVDTRTFTLRQVGGFTGQKSSNDASGPDGVVYIPGGNVYVGDVNVVKVVDPNAGAVIKTIPTGTAGLRSDEGCYDPDDNLVMFANPADAPPYATFISTLSNTVTGKYLFTTSAGLEACIYDRGTKNFFINNDGTPTNPNGELDVIPASSVVAGNPTVTAAYPLGNCGPTGIDLGPSEHLVIGCDAPAGSPQITLVVNATNGAILQTIAQVGGSDEVAYDPKLNRYYTASRNMTASGVSATGVPGATFTPVLGIIDAATNTWIANIPTGANAHSVAVDASTGNVFVPVPPTATTYGGIQVYGP